MAARLTPTFDDAMRAEIRRRLIDYMERHEIGAPTLYSRILSTAPKHVFERRTLQRLVKNEHRTQDPVYEACLLFLAASDDLVTRLGQEMSALFGEPPPKEKRRRRRGDPDRPAPVAGAPAPVPPTLAGTYRVYGKGAIRQPGEPIPVDVDDRLRFDFPYSRMEIGLVPGKPWLHVVEHVGNPSRRPADAEKVFATSAEVCTGSLSALYRSGTYLVTLRSFRWNHPKFYFLTDSNLFRGGVPPKLDGDFIDREPTGAGESVFATGRVLLVPESPDSTVTATDEAS